jgi:hypothetical protein
MGRFTHLDEPTLSALLARFGVTPVSTTPIDAGSVNTYVRVDDRSGTYYLRVDERADAAAVRHELALLARITAPPVPRVVPTLDGEAFTHHGDKPVLLSPPTCSASALADNGSLLMLFVGVVPWPEDDGLSPRFAPLPRPPRPIVRPSYWKGLD